MADSETSVIPLPPNQRLAAPGKWPVVGEREPLASLEPWSLTISGMVEKPFTYSLDDLREMPQVDRIIDIHCVTRWSKSQTQFSGVPLKTLLEYSSVSLDAKFVSFEARSARRHSSSLSLATAIEADVLIALCAEGSPLEEIHGGPIRSVCPGRYFYKSVKWLNQIEVLQEDRLGYWEAETGYHNNADPWKEERYVISNLDRQLVAKVLAAKDFSNLDLLGIQLVGHDLQQLKATDSKLRNANFSHANLEGSDFTRSNCSNANFTFCNLKGASFLNADVEGADFSGADLSGANFSGASLFGTTFCNQDGTEPATVDPGFFGDE